MSKRTHSEGLTSEILRRQGDTPLMVDAVRFELGRGALAPLKTQRAHRVDVTMQQRRRRASNSGPISLIEKYDCFKIDCTPLLSLCGGGVRVTLDERLYVLRFYVADGELTAYSTPPGSSDNAYYRIESDIFAREEASFHGSFLRGGMYESATSFRIDKSLLAWLAIKQGTWPPDCHVTFTVLVESQRPFLRIDSPEPNLQQPADDEERSVQLGPTSFPVNALRGLSPILDDVIENTDDEIITCPLPSHHVLKPTHIKWLLWMQLIDSAQLATWHFIETDSADYAFSMAHLVAMLDVAEHLALKSPHLFVWLKEHLTDHGRMNKTPTRDLIDIVDTLIARQWNAVFDVKAVTQALKSGVAPLATRK